MLLQLHEIDEVISRYTGEERDELIKYYLETARERLFDEKPVNRVKMELLKSCMKYIYKKESKGKNNTKESNIKESNTNTNENNNNSLSNPINNSLSNSINNSLSNLIDDVLNIKILQIRTIILEMMSSNYSLDKQYISKPERWFEWVIKDMKETIILDNSTNDTNNTNNTVSNSAIGAISTDIIIKYNKMLCKEIVIIFCSYEKFNSAGNQLILNILAYKDNIVNTLKNNYINKDVINEVEIEIVSLLNKIKSNFNKGKCLEMEKIEKIYKEYKK